MELQLIEDKGVLLRQGISFNNIVCITVTLGTTDTTVRSNGSPTHRGQRSITEIGYNF